MAYDPMIDTYLYSREFQWSVISDQLESSKRVVRGPFCTIAAFGSLTTSFTNYADRAFGVYAGQSAE